MTTRDDLKRLLSTYYEAAVEFEHARRDSETELMAQARIDETGDAIVAAFDGLVGERGPYAVTWARPDAPDDLLSCSGLSARLIVRRVRQAIEANGSVVIHSIHRLDLTEGR